jgi:signal transduction histidine kinase
VRFCREKRLATGVASDGRRPSRRPRHLDRRRMGLPSLRYARHTLGSGRFVWRRPARSLRAAALRRSEALLDNLPDVCCLILSSAGTVLEVRGDARGFLGRDAAALCGRSLLSPVEGRNAMLGLGRARWSALLGAAHEAGRTESEVRWRRGERDMHVQVTLVDLGRDDGVLCVLRDLSPVRAMEQALLRRNEELTQAAERLKEIDILKNEFMSNVSHELRTPLTAIIAYSEALLLAAPEAERQREFLHVIAEQGHKLQRLIGGLLDIAKLETLATELKLQQASLNDVVRAAVVTVKPLADKSRIALATALQPDLPDVWLDELRAQQIVWNLLTNAVKFSPPDSTVRVRTWSRDGRVWTSVADQGIGIAPEHQQLIFEKFVQLDGSTTRRQGGVGLGLDLVKHLVELHGGEVAVESTAGQGSVFTFSIPIEKRARPRLTDARSAQPATAGRHGG